MKKIYGYSTQGLKLLGAYIRKNPNKKKTEIFNEFAKKYSKSAGSVRNMYYALVKQSEIDGQIKSEYLKGASVLVKKPQTFEKERVEWLVREVLIASSKGVSVRRTLINLSNGDMKLYLRYQNKYRNLLKNDKKYIDNILLKLKENGVIKKDYWATEEVKKRINKKTFEKLQREIDALTDRLMAGNLAERTALKIQADKLESQVKKLMSALSMQESEEFKKNFIKNQNDIVS